MKLRSLIGALTLSLCPLSSAMADWAPSGPITLQIGFDAGGETDMLGRIVARKVSELTGWAIEIENKPGGGGVVMFSEIAVAKPDGQTIGLGVSMPILVNLVARGDRLPFDLDDFAYLGTVAYAQQAIIARKDAPFDDLHGLISYSIMAGGASISFDAKPQEMLLNVVNRKSGAGFKPVPMASSAEQIQNLLEGRVIASFTAGAHIPYLERGDVKMLASANATRHTYALATPTVMNTGFDVYLDPYFYFAAPVGLPKEAEEALARSLADAILSPDVTSAITDSFRAYPVNLGGEGAKQMMTEGLANVARLLGR